MDTITTFFIFSSKCNKLWIRFYSDAVITGQGFTANYTQSNDYLSLGDKNLINAAIPSKLFLFLNYRILKAEQVTGGLLNILQKVWFAI